jgi:hypothetical protein
MEALKIIHPDRYPEITEQRATGGQGSYQVRTNAVATTVAAIARGASYRSERSAFPLARE